VVAELQGRAQQVIDQEMGVSEAELAVRDEEKEGGAASDDDSRCLA
jgi:hypothetical protein